MEEDTHYKQKLQQPQIDPKTRTFANRVDSDSQQEEQNPKKIIRSQYGNMKVFFTKPIHVSLGPDYYCFIPTYIVFCLVTYFMINLVYTSTQNTTFRIITIFICVGQCISYLLVATSNPGIVTKQTPLKNDQTRKCNKCEMKVPKHARHCNDCNVCISQYDHHCPWTSKCIGGNNLTRFYIFLAWTPIYLIYLAVAFVACMSSQMVKIKQLPSQHL